MLSKDLRGQNYLCKIIMVVEIYHVHILVYGDLLGDQAKTHHRDRVNTSSTPYSVNRVRSFELPGFVVTFAWTETWD